MPGKINHYTDIIHIQSRLLLDSEKSFLSLSQRQAVELINRYSLQLADLARQTWQSESQYNTIRHELINILAPIVGYIEMLQDGWIGIITPDQQTHIETIHRNVIELRDVILKNQFELKLRESA